MVGDHIPYYQISTDLGVSILTKEIDMLPETFGFGMLGVSVSFVMPPMSCGEYVLTVKVGGHCRMMTVTMKQAHDAYRLSKSKDWMPTLMAGLMTIVADQPLVSLN